MAERVTFGDNERRRIRNAVRKVEHDTPPPSQPQRHFGENPPVVFYLLEELHAGSTGQAAVLRRQVSHETQIVTVVGGTQIQPGQPTGSFRLKWDPNNIEEDPLPNDTPLQTGSIRADATREEVIEALVQHPAIGENDVKVQVGGELSRWFITFTGIYAGKQVPLLQPVEDQDDFVATRASVEVSGETELEDTGFEVTLRAVIPTDTLMASRNNPITRFTPLRRGAIGVAVSVPGFGYIPVSIEPRELLIEAEFTPGTEY